MKRWSPRKAISSKAMLKLEKRKRKMERSIERCQQKEKKRLHNLAKRMWPLRDQIRREYIERAKRLMLEGNYRELEEWLAQPISTNNKIWTP